MIGFSKRSSTSSRASGAVSPPTSRPPIVTPGWISFGPGGGDGSVVVGGGSVVVGGAVVVGGVVSSADATGASAMKSATEQGRTAAVASRRIGG